ncbi:MAG: S8 family serine peptidase [Candidatus Lokiarchaeota archaeon]|nr:S8 family serine peptidase [Candidatus Lokiarchaeota archaeon]MBD3341760.1 S8 family serine peptidase [Candidatus Lokiarchaeota archaeon]
MKSFFKKSSLIFLTIILTINFAPLVLNSKNPNSIALSSNLKTKQNVPNLSIHDLNELIEGEEELKKQLDIVQSKYDEQLSKMLGNINYAPGQATEKVKVIISFSESLSKEERIQGIDEIFDDYDIIDNYDIIPATYIECTLQELIAHSKLINEHQSITRISESKLYRSPAFENDFPKVSALNKDSFENWWVPAVGADSISYDGTGVRVAVIDTGIYHHPDLNVVADNEFVTGSSTTSDGNGHGTHCAGIIGSDGGGSGGEYRGVAPGVSLINAKAGSDEGGLYEADIISAIDWCVDTANADIISMSFGGGAPDPYDSITEAIASATSQGVICVVAAGNEGPDYFTGSSPASGVDAISVGATDENNNIASFTSWGPTYTYLGYPDVAAPGVDIISTEAANSLKSTSLRYVGNYFDFSGTADYIPLSGTSMACPMVAGILAILKEAYPYLTPEAARIALLEGAYNISKKFQDDYLKAGAGIVNVSASLNYLEQIESLYTDYNDTAKVYPNILPFQPYDFVNFPGESQKFNLTIISGASINFDFEIPTINGLSLKMDEQSPNFADPGVLFSTLEIKVEKDAMPGIRTFQINLTSGGRVYDTINVSLEIKIPEYRILMDSYHGMNDLIPEFSHYQMGFHEAMTDIVDLNISIDYSMEYWDPDYDKNTDNSILTDEKLNQYDLVVLQTPILPYNPIEITNLVNYYNEGGDILFLGTRYQDMCVENINPLFSELGVDIQIKKVDVENFVWIGYGAFGYYQNVSDLDEHAIFEDVNGFIWQRGTAYTVSGNADSIASLSGETVVAAYNGSSEGKGNFVAFGDSTWIFNEYDDESFYEDHNALLNNLFAYLLPREEVSLTIELSSYWSSSAQVNISIYAMDQESNEPITSSVLDSYLNISISGPASDMILMNSPTDGVAINTTYDLPLTSTSPYTISVNLTIEGKTYNKTAKILYYASGLMPQITDLGFNDDDVSRSGIDSVDLTATTDLGNYDVNAYLTVYSGNPFNYKGALNKTINLAKIAPLVYENSFDPSTSDPSGYASVYILPEDLGSGYINPNSQRLYIEVENSAPQFDISNSEFRFEDGDESFQGSQGFYFEIAQGEEVDFEVVVADSIDSTANLRVFVNFFVSLITPSTFVVSELSYSSGKFVGDIEIPEAMSYNTLGGTTAISTETDVQEDSRYIGILYVTVIDKEGAASAFLIYLEVVEDSDDDEESITDDFLILFLIIAGLIAIASIIIVAVVLINKRKKGDDYLYEY